MKRKEKELALQKKKEKKEKRNEIEQQSKQGAAPGDETDGKRNTRDGWRMKQESADRSRTGDV